MRTALARARRPESGQVASEYLGIITLVASLVLVLIMGATGVGGTIAAEIKAAICRIVGGDCSPNSAFSAPTESCTVNSHSTQAKGSVTVFSVDLGADGKWTISKESDGTYDVTVQGGRSLGGKVGAGGEVHGSAGTGQQAAGDHIEGEFGVTGTRGQTWKNLTEKQARDLYEDAWHDAMKKSATEFLGPGQGLGMWVADKVDGHHWDPPPADETFYEGGTFGAVKGTYKDMEGGIGGKNLIGVKTVNTGPDKGSRTYYFKVTRDGSVQAGGGLDGTPFSLDASGKLAGDGVMSITYDSSGQPKEMKLQAAGEFEGEFGMGTEIKGASAKDLLAGLKKVSTSGSQQTGKKGVVTMTVDLTNKTNRDAVADLFHSVYIPALDKDGTPNPSARRALSTLYNQFENPQGGTRLQVTTYDTKGTKYGAGGTAGDGIEFGFDGNLSFADERISSASYYVPGQGMVIWKECTVG